MDEQNKNFEGEEVNSTSPKKEKSKLVLPKWLFLIIGIIILAVIIIIASTPRDSSNPSDNSNIVDENNTPNKPNSIICNHSWSDATCLVPKTCVLCSKTEGVAKGHDWTNATCNSPKTCSRCDTTTGTALGHTTDSGTCSRCGKNFSSWKTASYVDEFNQDTDDKYIYTIAYGTFSNSATTNSSLMVQFFMDVDDICIKMWEYSKYVVKGSSSSEYYYATILDDAGVKHSFTTTLYKNGDRLFFKDADRSKVINLLKNNDSVKIYIESSKYTISKYLFTVNCKGFYESYNKL